MSIKNYTTQIDFNKTLGEIDMILARHGVTHINRVYEGGLPVALYFTMTVAGQPVNFKLPCNYGATLKILERSKSVGPKLKTKEQALRVSWRIIKDWVDAQMAIIQTEMVSMEQVFLPYIVVDQLGTALYESASAMKQLTSGGKA